MRLGTEQIACIKNMAYLVWGGKVQVRLFGSRVDGHQRGADIDLYIEGVDLSLPSQAEIKTQFLAKLKRQIGDQRIDVVFAPAYGQAALPIHRMAQQTGVHL